MLLDADRPICSCGNLCTPNGFRVDGRRKYRKLCSSCKKKKYRTGEYRNIDHKKELCDKCGFVPEHLCQLDVDHIDGDKGNDKKENLQTLCSNCHRLKTWLNREYNKNRNH